jgi:hypothetical protein
MSSLCVNPAESRQESMSYTQLDVQAHHVLGEQEHPAAASSAQHQSGEASHDHEQQHHEQQGESATANNDDDDDDDDEAFTKYVANRPPRISPFLNTPKQRKVRLSFRSLTF